MQQELKVVNISADRTAVDGLDGFFAKGDEQANQLTADKGLSIKQAVHYYNEPSQLIKQMIHDGTIPAVRMKTEKGLAWRIFPSGIPQGVEAVPPKDKQETQSKNQILPEAFEAVKELAESAVKQVGQLQRSLKRKEESDKKKRASLKAVKATATTATERIQRQETSFGEMQESFESLADQLVDAHCMIAEMRAELLELQSEVRAQSARKPFVVRIWNRLSQPLT